ncbi:MAG: PAS domain-containing protein [Pseudohongiellaceae bacterium]|nr:PAS domain-containing protein [Pseudohongiellaceae bacterium]
MSENKIIDDLLYQSTELMNLRTILDKVGAYIYSKDLDGNYTYANSLVVELFGMPASEIYGKDDSHFFDLELSNQLQINDQKVMNENITIQQEEANYIKATGETRIYWTIKAPIFDENKEVIGMCGISTDITQQKKLESTLERESSLLKAILDNVDAHVYLKDSERRYVYANPKVAELLRKSPDNIIRPHRSRIAIERKR